MTKNLRLKEARLKSGLTQGELGQRFNVSSQYINKLESEKGFSYKKAKQFAEVLNVDPDWLYFGDTKGHNEPQKDTKATKIIPMRTHQGVPFYDIDVTAGAVTSFSDVKEEPEYYVDYQPFNDCTAYLPVYGNSMFPMFASGEVVAVKQIFNLDALLFGEAYLVITNAQANSLRTIKLIFQVENDESKLALRSSNPQFKGDTIINKVDIVSLYKIKGKIQRLEM